jgi:hypothetical protein
MRVAGSGRLAGVISPTDVESPMCTTDVHDVRPLAAPAAVVGGATVDTPDGAATDADDAAEASPATVVVAAVESAEDDRDASIQAPTTVSTTTSTAGMANARGIVTGAGRYRRALAEGGARGRRRRVRSAHQARRGSQ